MILKQQQKTDEARKRHGRHHLLVYFKDGRKAQGTCRSMNLKEPGFFLECEDNQGISTNESIRVSFDEIKMVCNVKSYTGNFDKRESYQEYAAGGSHIIVRFFDREIVEGVTMNAYVPNNQRFYLIPRDPSSNNINILVETSAIDSVFTPEEYLAQQHEKKEKKQSTNESVTEEPVKDVELGQEESMGDFYFETHNYPSACEQYLLAEKQNADSPRIEKKIVVAIVNIGIQYIKTRDYRQALQYMEQALERDPDNPHAKKKAKQLKHTIEKTERRMRDYEAQRERQKKRTS